MTLAFSTTNHRMLEPSGRHSPAAGGVGIGMGTHLLVEMWRAPFAILADARIISKALDCTGPLSDGCNSTQTEVRVHQFNPYGVSGTASSPLAHVLIHTWPEKEYAAVDIYARGNEDAYEVLERMKNRIRPVYVHVMELTRGQLLEAEDT